MTLLEDEVIVIVLLPEDEVSVTVFPDKASCHCFLVTVYPLIVTVLPSPVPMITNVFPLTVLLISSFFFTLENQVVVLKSRSSKKV